MLCIVGMAGWPPALGVVTRRALPHRVHCVCQAPFVTKALWFRPHRIQWPSSTFYSTNKANTESLKMHSVHEICEGRK